MDGPLAHWAQDQGCGSQSHGSGGKPSARLTQSEMAYRGHGSPFVGLTYPWSPFTSSSTCGESVAGVRLEAEVEELMWQWESDGKLSSKLSNKAFFACSTMVVAVDQLWRSREPHNCRFFAWLASQNRCWMAAER